MKIQLRENISSRVIDSVLSRVRKNPQGIQNVTFDLSETSFIDPGGVVCLLDLCRFFIQHDVELEFKRMDETVSSYLSKISFWNYLKKMRGEQNDQSTLKKPDRGSDVLLGLSRIREHSDIPKQLRRVKQRAGHILSKYLKYPDKELDRFLTAFSELCQNVVEHSEDIGTVTAQKYYYRKRLGRNVVKIAVSDLGRGIKDTLDDKFSELTDWDDQTAIRKALFQGASRFDDEGRGHGLSSVRQYTKQWNGRLSIRSGEARISIVPDWSDYQKEEEKLPCFPGTQVVLVLPEKQSDDLQKTLFD